MYAVPAIAVTSTYCVLFYELRICAKIRSSQPTHALPVEPTPRSSLITATEVYEEGGRISFWLLRKMLLDG